MSTQHHDHDINCARMLSPDPTAPCTCNDELQRLRTEMQQMLAMMDDPYIHFDTEWWKVKLRGILGQESPTELSRNETYWQSRFVAVENKYNLLRQELCGLSKTVHTHAVTAYGSAERHIYAAFAKDLEAILDKGAADSVKPAETLESLRERWIQTQRVDEEFDVLVAIARAVAKEG